MAESALHLGCNLVSTFYLEGYLLHRTGGNFQSQRNRKLLLWHHNGSITSIEKNSKISWFHRAFLEAQATMRDEVWLSIASFFSAAPAMGTNTGSPQLSGWLVPKKVPWWLKSRYNHGAILTCEYKNPDNHTNIDGNPLIARIMVINVPTIEDDL